MVLMSSCDPEPDLHLDPQASDRGCSGISGAPGVRGWRSYRSVTSGAERLRHALFRPRQDVAAGSHRPADQHRLTCELDTTVSQPPRSTFTPT